MDPSRPPKIRIDNLFHYFSSRRGTVLTLRDFNLNIREGEIVSVVGASGCGKTTLLNIIAGFLRPTRGTVLVDGDEIRGPGYGRGVVFQDYALFRWLTVQGNVEFGLRMRGVPSKERRELSDYYIELVGLTKFRHRYPYELSGGMKQRVAIARVFANQSGILLMDEPFASLDAQTREVMQEELLQLWTKTRKTVLFVTHSIDEAIFIAQKVVVMTFRPGTVKKIIDVELPEHRYNYHIRTSPEFIAIKGEILDSVREETKRQMVSE